MNTTELFTELVTKGIHVTSFTFSDETSDESIRMLTKALGYIQWDKIYPKLGKDGQLKGFETRLIGSNEFWGIRFVDNDKLTNPHFSALAIEELKERMVSTIKSKPILAYNFSGRSCLVKFDESGSKFVVKEIPEEEWPEWKKKF